MNRIYLIIPVLLICTSGLEAKRIDGLIIRQNDTIKVSLEIPMEPLQGKPDYLRLQRSIIYYETGKKSKIKPFEAKEIQFSIDNDLKRMISRRMNTKMNNVYTLDSVMFLKLDSDGYLKLFSFFSVNARGPNIESCLMQKGEEELKWIKFFGFRKDMTEYLNDCNSATDLINKSNSSIRDLIQIVEFYNQNCKKL